MMFRKTIVLIGHIKRLVDKRLHKVPFNYKKKKKKGKTTKDLDG